MVPVHELAVHARLSAPAELRVSRKLRVLRMGWVLPSQFSMWALVVPVYTAPARVRVAVNGMGLKLPGPVMAPESSTAQGPDGQRGLNCQVSVHCVPVANVPPGDLTTWLPTVHDPSRMAAETGGVTVLAVRMEDRRERVASRTAVTW